MGGIRKCVNIEQRGDDPELSCGHALDDRTHTSLPRERHDCLVGIPAYNEDDSIRELILVAKRYADRIVVVDDGSADRTGRIARRAGAHVITHDRNEGKGAAVRSILEFARGNEWDALVLLDGDGQHLPDDIPKVAEPIIERKADLVIGSRYLEPRGNDETPRHRRMGQRALDALVSGICKVPLSDSQSGFRALSPLAVSELTLTTDGFGIESEMIAVAAQKDLPIVERPIEGRYRGIDGQTLNPFSHGLNVVASLLPIIRGRRY